jgi:hypothetical protein
VNDGNSDLYHEVGFRISLHAPFSNVEPAGAVRVDSGPLQQLAAAFGTLTLDVCRVAQPGGALTVDATTPAGAPDRYGAGAAADRTDCRTWVLHPDDPPVVLTAWVDSTAGSEPAAAAQVELPCGAPSTGDPSFVETESIAYPAHTLDAHATGPVSSHLLEAETVVSFTTRSRVDLVVPAKQVGHLSFGAREGPRATRRLSMPECTVDQGSPWTVSAIRIWVDEPGCVPVVVTTPRSKRTVMFAVGAPCPTTTSSTPTATLDCTNPIGFTPPPRSEIMGGQVALLTSRSRHTAAQVAEVSDPGAHRYRWFAKSPLFLRTGSGVVRIEVPRSEHGRVALSWGNTDHDGTATRVFGAGPCPGGSAWIAFPGGYSVTEPHCVTLVVRAGGQAERVRIGVGKACPGQRPPPPVP